MNNLLVGYFNQCNYSNGVGSFMAFHQAREIRRKKYSAGLPALPHCCLLHCPWPKTLIKIKTKTNKNKIETNCGIQLLDQISVVSVVDCI